MITASPAGRHRLDAFRHEHLPEIGSTNTAALERARSGDPGHLWITADRQLGGRGRRGRPWASEPGNLYASLLLMDVAPIEALGSLPLAVAVAVQRAVQAVLPPDGAKAAVKWPNDILIDGRKMCGILIEGEKLPDGRHAVVIGIGINIATAPEATLYPVTTIREAGGTVLPDELFTHLFMEMAAALHLWDAGRGLEAIVADWRAAAHGIGRPITVNMTDRSIPGRFVDIDETGRLMLETDDGAVMRIAAGDVFFTPV
ncbi:biotin--[acetyl-CoA-carboxylase] ligase [Rhizobium sp. SG2393]|uniref:biotin--[acetyl-CoA-carboxylase] ligase n=1 Tax=Rhizobium sp. SG2393 TaxID=3276279 RepID=UPI00366E70AD